MCTLEIRVQDSEEKDKVDVKMKVDNIKSASKTELRAITNIRNIVAAELKKLV